MYSNNAILVLQWTHSMDSIWTPYGLHMDLLHGLHLDLLHGLHMDFLHGLHMDLLHGLLHGYTIFHMEWCIGC